MLQALHIHNYAIIDKLSIEFSPQLNAITGETGAGKSILMGALSLILGDRADTGVLLDRDKKCIVEGVFTPANRAQLDELLVNNDLESGEEGIVIRREIAVNGKSRAFVNDTPVNLELLRQISSLLVDLHRQFDTLSLSDARFQLEVLDALAGNSVALQQYQQIFKAWKAAQEELARLQQEKLSFNKEYDYHKFLFDELEEAALKENELEEADTELKMLSHAEEMKSVLSGASSSLSEGEQPLLQQLKSIKHQLDSFANYHPVLAALLQRMHSAQLELQDIADDIESLNDKVSLDPSRIAQLNERMSAGYSLLKKHGVKTTAELIHIQQDLAAKLEAVLNIDEHMQMAEKKLAVLQAKIDTAAAQLTERRVQQVKPLQEKVNQLLTKVGMPNARLQVSMSVKTPDSWGRDDVDFLFDANKSNRFEPVRKVASGGELSRLMLSIKSLVAESMDLPTLIFDEIDTGISGEAARQVGMIMHKLGTKRQVITITHQPQIAGKAQAHYFVYKEKKGESVRTNIRALSGEERVKTIAQMLSGEKPTAAAMENAREMVGI